MLQQESTSMRKLQFLRPFGPLELCTHRLNKLLVGVYTVYPLYIMQAFVENRLLYLWVSSHFYACGESQIVTICNYGSIVRTNSVLFIFKLRRSNRQDVTGILNVIRVRRNIFLSPIYWASHFRCTRGLTSILNIIQCDRMVCISILYFYIRFLAHILYFYLLFKSRVY